MPTQLGQRRNRRLSEHRERRGRPYDRWTDDQLLDNASGGPTSTSDTTEEASRARRFPRRQSSFFVHELVRLEWASDTAQWRPACWMWAVASAAVPGSSAGNYGL